jgi:hypothetical protein
MIQAKPHLTPDELANSLAILDIERLEFSRILDIDMSAITRWLQGATPIPGPVTVLVRLLVEQPALLQRIIVEEETNTSEPILRPVRKRSGRGRPIKDRD